MTAIISRLALLGAALSITSMAHAADVASNTPSYSGLIEAYAAYDMPKGDMPEFGDNGIDDDRKNNPIMGGFSAVNLPMSDGLSAQMDLSGRTMFVSSDEDTVESELVTSALHSTLHISGRSDMYLLGAMGGIGRVSFHDDNSSTFWFAGAEYQAYLGNATLYLQGGYLDSTQAEENTTDTLQDAYFVRGMTRFYVGDTTRLTTQVAYAAGESDTSENIEDASVLAWGVRADQQLSDSPASLFLAYSGANYRGGVSDCKSDWYDHRVMLGVSFAFGGTSMMANDRQGVALDTPDFGDWVGASEMNQGYCGVS